MMVGLLLAAETCGRNVLSGNGNGNGKDETKRREELMGISADEEDIYRGYRRWVSRRKKKKMIWKRFAPMRRKSTGLDTRLERERKTGENAKTMIYSGNPRRVYPGAPPILQSNVTNLRTTAYPSYFQLRACTTIQSSPSLPSPSLHPCRPVQRCAPDVLFVVLRNARAHACCLCGASEFLLYRYGKFTA